MHWCGDESMALLASLPIIGYYFNKIHIWWHNKFKHPCHKKSCEKTHPVHVDREFDSYSNEYDLMYPADVVERFGRPTVEALFNSPFLKIKNCNIYMFEWRVNNAGALSATYNNRTFIHDSYCSEEEPWEEMINLMTGMK